QNELLVLAEDDSAGPVGRRDGLSVNLQRVENPRALEFLQIGVGLLFGHSHSAQDRDRQQTENEAIHAMLLPHGTQYQPNDTSITVSASPASSPVCPWRC